MRGTTMIIAAVSFLLTTTLPRAAIAQDSDRTAELYHIFDFKTAARRGEMIAALTDGLHMNVSNSHTTTPIVMGAPPEKPDRFDLIDPTKNGPLSGLAGLMGAAQAGRFKQVTCDGAVWIANADRRVTIGRPKVVAWWRVARRAMDLPVQTPWPHPAGPGTRHTSSVGADALWYVIWPRLAAVATPCGSSQVGHSDL